MQSSPGENPSRSALLKLLVKLGLVRKEDVPSFPASEGLGVIASLAARGLIDEGKALRTLGGQLGLTMHSITQADWDAITILLESTPVSNLSLSRWRSLKAVPLRVEGDRVLVAIANPVDREAVQELEFSLGRKVIVGLSSESEILSALDRKLSSNAGLDLQALVDQAATDDSSVEAVAAGTEANLFANGDVAAAPVVTVVDKIFSDSVQSGASDIHISPEKERLVVRARIDGILRELFAIPAHLRGSVISRIKLLAGMDISERRRPQDGRIRIKAGFGTRDLRVSSVPAVHGENIVVRILSPGVTRTSFDSLGMPADVREGLTRAVHGSSRVVLVTGPTGSGKTSSLYAALISLIDGKRNIITVEDPIEYRVEGITQIQVNPKINLSFADGLRSILRQDPDVIMVGEIRDLETASIAMQAAQTGHLVLSTVHTNSAPAAITRLRDIGVEPYVIASSISTILAQRLVRALCPECATTPSARSREIASGLGLPVEEIRGEGNCAECGNSGFRGRTGVYSLLEISEEIRTLIREDADDGEIERVASRNGFKNLWRSGIELLKSGKTSLEELERVLGPIEAAQWRLEEAPLSHTKPASPSLSKRKLLLVEDDDSTRAVLAMVFQDQFFEVIEASNGVEALERIHKELPEIIVSDLMMPRMSGAELVQRLKADSRTREIPVLILTAAGTEEREIQLIRGGADDFVSKTADTQVVVARVHRLLSRSLIAQ